MYHKGCYHGWKMLILGLIVLGNELYFQYSWWLVLGGLLTLKGVLHLVFPDKFHGKKK